MTYPIQLQNPGDDFFDDAEYDYEEDQLDDRYGQSEDLFPDCDYEE